MGDGFSWHQRHWPVDARRFPHHGPARTRCASLGRCRTGTSHRKRLRRASRCRVPWREMAAFPIRGLLVLVANPWQRATWLSSLRQAFPSWTPPAATPRVFPLRTDPLRAISSSCCSRETRSNNRQKEQPGQPARARWRPGHFHCGMTGEHRNLTLPPRGRTLATP